MITNSAKILTIGTFDGVHLGHQKILKYMVELAMQQELIPAVLTLFPHPRMVLQKDDDIKLLNTIDERIQLLKNYGIKDVIVKEFTQDFANLSSKDYVKQILVDELNAKQVVIGYDHHFGKNRSGNIEDLKNFAKEFNFKVEEISAQEIKDVTISSTKIRNALNQGNIEVANSYLGYNYFFSGKVVKGKGIGKTLSFPTANIQIEETYKLVPCDGVYAVKSIFNSLPIYGMMNIGTNPTVGGRSRSIEVHFFDFNENLYDQTLSIEFLNFIRKEQKFENLDALKTQLQKDKNSTLTYIKTNHV
ncbi:bifunctional riboflavin kinase/FAD synthetase [Winogradskyella aquimaris]|uniref:Riboflavin biosynthesis protein n=1 Tax=Winogradskyella aquimaris TaxID=864074 RepID=A0ABU5EIC7_9FLAO|nr:bifunctional riboflavin kinase/FAD synthetase [Winogradskyella aquimaris]MDY2586030.1 bifunctional riboflavin kinase/FAD synthetase [Winogradskyella aquimaris]